MSARPVLGERALQTLAAIRIANGLLGLLAPALLVKRTSGEPTSTAPYYAFRMFGIRTIVLGADLLLLTGEAQQRARTEAVIIHGCDTVSAVVGGLRGDQPAKIARMTVTLSAVNTALAVVARFWAPPPDADPRRQTPTPAALAG